MQIYICVLLLWRNTTTKKLKPMLFNILFQIYRPLKNRVTLIHSLSWSNGSTTFKTGMSKHYWLRYKRYLKPCQVWGSRSCSSWAGFLGSSCSSYPAWQEEGSSGEMRSMDTSLDLCLLTTHWSNHWRLTLQRLTIHSKWFYYLHMRAVARLWLPKWSKHTLEFSSFLNHFSPSIRCIDSLTKPARWISSTFGGKSTNILWFDSLWYGYDGIWNGIN